MQVEVLTTTARGRVRVRSDYGTFTAQWHGPRPEVGSTQRVEIDVDDVAVWHQAVVLQDAATQELVDNGPCVQISGLVLELRADDVLVVTLDGSPVMSDASRRCAA
jgi:hypothetical protein